MTNKIYLIEIGIEDSKLNYSYDGVSLISGAFQTQGGAAKKAKELYMAELELLRMRYPGIEKHTIENEDSYEIEVLFNESEETLMESWRVVEIEMK